MQATRTRHVFDEGDGRAVGMQHRQSQSRDVGPALGEPAEQCVERRRCVCTIEQRRAEAGVAMQPADRQIAAWEAPWRQRQETDEPAVVAVAPKRQQEVHAVLAGQRPDGGQGETRFEEEGLVETAPCEVGPSLPMGGDPCRRHVHHVAERPGGHGVSPVQNA